MKNINTNSKKGYAIIIALVFLAIFASISAVIVSSVSQYSRDENKTVADVQAMQLAEAAVDKAMYELNQNPSYTGENNTSVGGGTFTITVNTVNSSTKNITVTSYVPNSTNPQSTKTVKVTAGINNTVISFRYGVQVGSGGFVMDGGSSIQGSVYSNGDIVATNGVTITGSAVAANQPALSTDQVNDSGAIASCAASTCVTFGNAAATEDFAQSFKISDGLPINNIQFYIKKVGNPGDETVRIVTDNSGSPSATTLMTGTLAAASVSTNFGWVQVTFPTTPVLDPSQTYWMVIDGASSAAKYYIIGANSNGYATGAAKIGKMSGTWNNTTPSGLDGYFKIYLGGQTSTIGGNNYVTGVMIGTTGTDDAWAHTIKGATVSGTIYCQVGSFISKACNTNKPDPQPQPMPLSDQNIQDWKDDATAGGTISAGDYTVGFAGKTLGPGVINGNLIVNGGGTLNVMGTIYVKGNLTLSGGGKIKLDASYGASSGTIVLDGYVTLNGGSSFAGSGTTGSYPFLITTSDCPVGPGCNGNYAINLSGGAGTVALIAQNGTVQLAGGSALKQVTAKQIYMTGGATLLYDAGLISENFSSGPGGSFEFTPGTYTIVP